MDAPGHSVWGTPLMRQTMIAWWHPRGQRAEIAQLQPNLTLPLTRQFPFKAEVRFASDHIPDADIRGNEVARRKRQHFGYCRTGTVHAQQKRRAGPAFIFFNDVGNFFVR